MTKRTYIITLDENERELPLDAWFPTVYGLLEGDVVRVLSPDEDILIVPRDETVDVEVNHADSD